MTLPSIVRVFFAIELPASIKTQLGSFIHLLKKKSKSHAVRWTNPDNLHITLQFLAEVSSVHLPQLVENVQHKIAGQVKKPLLMFGEPRLFPNPFRPRVIVLDVSPQAELGTLAGLIGEGIKLAQYDIDTRPFRAHLTLGRIKQPHGLNLRFLSEFTAPDIEAILIEEVVLFRSEPQPEGSRYTVIERLGLTHIIKD